MSRSTATIRKNFKHRLSNQRIIVAPGVFDALSGRIAECLGFEAVFLSGSSLSFSQLGRPDIGLLTMPELVDAMNRLSDRISLPVVADVDSAFGAAPHAGRLMRQFEKAGAAAVQIEDQAVVKPDDALLARPLVSIEDMSNKIKAMADAREAAETLISARTDSRDPNDAIERCLSYKKAGADLVFAEGLRDADDIKRLVSAVGTQTPVVYNTSYKDGAATSAPGLEALGVRVALFPALAVQSAAASMLDTLTKLKNDPALNGGAATPLPARELMALLEADPYLSQFDRSQNQKTGNQ